MGVSSKRRRWALTAVTVGVALAVVMPAVPAQADHGYQTFKFTNKQDRKVHQIDIKFDRKLSHIGDEEPKGWPGVECELQTPYFVRCEAGSRPLDVGDSFRLSVATPPKDDGSYDRAKIEQWEWGDKGGSRIGRQRQGCTRRAGCIDLGVQG